MLSILNLKILLLPIFNKNKQYETKIDFFDNVSQKNLAYN